jgi:MFS transporter, ACS family, hexuronate transporter
MNQAGAPQSSPAAPVIGFSGMAGAVGGIFVAKAVGAILQWTGSYVPIFVIAGSAYLIALFIFQILPPKLEPTRLD